ncbi:hypothetical protein M0805_006952 [Coniferiporia weirii]|nr:hypothetical protein M0805_006952 [Coniferiporia weirii]
MNTRTEIKLPDMCSMCPFPCSLNPLYKQVGEESLAWINSYHILGDKTHAFFQKTNASLMAAYSYPFATHEKLRTASDLTNVLFGMDEISDLQSGANARLTTGRHVRMLLGELACDNSDVSRMTTVFRERLIEQFGPHKKSLNRLLTNYKNYMDAVVIEAEQRESQTVLSSEEYRIFRRENGAVKPTFDMIECCLGIELPDEVIDDPTFKRLYNTALDIILWANDLHSYNMEQAREGHSFSNIITVVMKEKGIALQEAIDYVAAELQTFFTQFVADKAVLPSFGAVVDSHLRGYISGMEDWIAGYLQFAFETPRYFGPNGKEVEKTNIVKLLERGETF